MSSSPPQKETDLQFLARGLKLALTGSAHFTVADHKRLQEIVEGKEN